MLVNKIMPRKLRGFTLTEAAIVLGIVGLILGAIWVAAAAVYNNLRVSTTSNQLLQIVQSIRSIHSTQQTVDPELTALLVAQAGGMPKDMLDDPNAPASVSDVWGGVVDVNPQEYGGIADSAFSVEFNDVPDGPCADLLVRTTGAGRDSGLVGAGNAAAVDGTGVPSTLTSAVAACGDAEHKNKVVFTFRLKS